MGVPAGGDEPAVFGIADVVEEAVFFIGDLDQVIAFMCFAGFVFIFLGFKVL